VVAYVDSSALLKLVWDEAESVALRRYVADTRLASSELILTEIPRGVRRVAASDATLPTQALIERARGVLDDVSLVPLNRALLLDAGALAEPVLRSLDAIHVASAASLHPLDAFVTYDVRQAAAARLAGLRTVAPGTDDSGV
jgi:predicted nucleic acid-binding protein